MRLSTFVYLMLIVMLLVTVACRRYEPPPRPEPAEETAATDTFSPEEAEAIASYPADHYPPAP